MSGRRSLKYALPACAYSPEIETAQMRDLVLKRRFGRGTTTATFVLHRIRPPVWPGPERQAQFCPPLCERPDPCRFALKQGLDRDSFGRHREERPGPNGAALPLRGRQMRALRPL